MQVASFSLGMKRAYMRGHHFSADQKIPQWLIKIEAGDGCSQAKQLDFRYSKIAGGRKT